MEVCPSPLLVSNTAGPCCRLAGWHHTGVVRRRRYPTDLTNAQWALLDPKLPDPPAMGGKGGRHEEHCRRVIIDAWLYLLDNGIKWRGLPADFPPWRTVHNIVTRWEEAGVSQQILDDLRGRERKRQGRNTQPTGAVIDSQSVKAAETVGAGSRGFDAGKLINGRKRHLVVDTLGLLIAVVVTSAGLHDSKGARLVLQAMAKVAKKVRMVWADCAYRGTLIDWAKETLKIVVTIVPRPRTKTFQVLPRRWVVERTIGWTTRARRLARDYERLPATSEMMIRWVHIRLLIRRLA